MSSFKKAIKARRKTHKERQQPGSRAHLGLLEKGKDWKRRRDDFHFKEKRLRAMSEKIRNRNEDEFYFAMIKSKTKEGVHVASRKNEGYSAEEMKLLKSQDLGYINLRATQEREQIEKLKAAMHILVPEDETLGKSNLDDEFGSDTIGATPKHVIFVDSKQKVKKFDPVKHFDTAPELVGRTFNRPRVETLRTQTISGPASKKVQEKVDRKRKGGFEELSKRIDRLEQLEKVAAKMMQEKQMLGKGKKVKVKGGDGQPTVYKWKRQRKR